MILLDEQWRCDYCGSFHTGPTTYSKDGETEKIGNFCCRSCFDKWSEWKHGYENLTERYFQRNEPSIGKRIFLNCLRCGTQYSLGIPYKEANHPSRDLCDSCILDLSMDEFKKETWKPEEVIEI